MGEGASLLVALAAASAFAVLALLTWITVRLEQVRRAQRPRPCERLHAADLHERWLEGVLPREEARLDEGLAAEDLPAFRGPVRPWRDDEESVNPMMRPRR